MWLRADSTRPERVSGSARTETQRLLIEADNFKMAHVKFGDDCTNA